MSILFCYSQLTLAATLPQDDPKEVMEDTTGSEMEPIDDLNAEIDALLELLRQLSTDIAAKPEETNKIFDDFLNKVFNSEETQPAIPQETDGPQ